jgi:drug/metabolite transporter (DMT)-like permease
VTSVTSPYRGIAFALVAALLYGIAPIAARLCYEVGFAPLDVVTLRALILLLIMAVAATVLRSAFHLPKQVRLAFFGLVLSTLMVSCGLMAAIAFIPISTTVLIFYTFPVIIALTAPWIEQQAVSGTKIILALLCFAGLAYGLAPQLGALDVRGLLLAALAALGYVLQFYAGRRMSTVMEPVPLVVLVHIAALPLFLCLMFFLTDNTGVARAISGAMATLLILITGVLFCAAYFSHMSSVKHAPAATVAPYFNLEPVVSTGLAAMVFKEQLTHQHMVGGAIVLAVVIALSLMERNKPA